MGRRRTRATGKAGPGVPPRRRRRRPGREVRRRPMRSKAESVRLAMTAAGLALAALAASPAMKTSGNGLSLAADAPPAVAQPVGAASAPAPGDSSGAATATAPAPGNASGAQPAGSPAQGNAPGAQPVAAAT